MRVVLRRPTGSDAEPVILAVLGATGALAAAWLALGLPTPRCLFHAATGVPCLTCGATRCARRLLAGQPWEALAWNPLVFAALVAAVVLAGYALVVVTFHLPRVRVQSLTHPQWLAIRVSLALIVAANWIYLVFHFSRGA